jgi:tetratricopeptide (TPR) repeat protein
MMMQSRTWLPIFVLLAELSSAIYAYAGNFIVDGITVGARISSSNPNYRSYHCKPSDDFANALRCERSRETRDNGRNVTIDNTLIHSQDNTALYVMSNVASVTFNRSAADGEINRLSSAIGERPAKVLWFPENRAPSTAVVAVWGQINLVEVTGEASSTLSEGKSPHLGVLVDTLGDLKKSANDGAPVYRLTGGSGFIYTASFDASGHGNRHYVAAEAAQLAMLQFESAATKVLQQDQSLAGDDYSLWPQLAIATRRLALDTSPETANSLVEKVFEKNQSKKLYSHVWAVLPGGPIEHLPNSEFWPVDIYGPKTEHPTIRRDLQNVIAKYPADRFIDFAYYVLGDFDHALQANPHSIIGNAIRYARGHGVIESILKDAVAIVNTHKSKDITDPEGVVYRIEYMRENADIYDHKLLGNMVPDFAKRAATAKPDLEAVLLNKTTNHADDAAYFLGWLAFQQGKSKEALPYLSQALVSGNGDFKEAALKLAVRIELENPAAEQFKIVNSGTNFSKQAVLWYVAARSAYREFDYATTVKEVQRAFEALNIPLDRLPATTDPGRLDAAIKRINPDLDTDMNFVELPYLLQASTEFLDYQSYLKSAGNEHPNVLTARAHAIIVKYSMLLDRPDQPAHPPQLAHKDLRQALHLIDLTLEAVPQGAANAKLREWLYYRKVRISAVYAPKTVPDIIAAMKQEFPNSGLLDDVLAEQIYAQGVIMRDVPAAEKTFQTLIREYPNGNAVDNAYGWMAILYRCVGRTQDALVMNREILQRFPITRHAKYARERMANPAANNCGLQGFDNNS